MTIRRAIIRSATSSRVGLGWGGKNEQTSVGTKECRWRQTTMPLHHYHRHVTTAKDEDAMDVDDEEEDKPRCKQRRAKKLTIRHRIIMDGAHKSRGMKSVQKNITNNTDNVPIIFRMFFLIFPSSLNWKLSKITFFLPCRFVRSFVRSSVKKKKKIFGHGLRKTNEPTTLGRSKPSFSAGC